MFVAVGFVDTTCSPSSVYSAYNALSGPKEILHMYRSSHAISDEAKKKAAEFAIKHTK